MAAHVLGIGTVGAATTLLGESLPETGRTSDAAHGAISVADGIPATLQTLTTLGAKCAILGVTGDDTTGEFVSAELSRLGIDIDAMLRIGITGVTSSVITALGWNRYTFYPTFSGHAGSKLPAFSDEVVTAAVAKANAIVVDTASANVALAAVTIAKQRRLPVIAHLTRLVEGSADIIANADVLIASERTANELAPHGELLDSLADLCRFGPKVAVVTLAERGAIARVDGEVYSADRFAVEVLDSYGAGSAFVGGFVAALLSELPLRACLEAGNAAGALACQQLGPLNRDCDRKVLAALIATRNKPTK